MRLATARTLFRHGFITKIALQSHSRSPLVSVVFRAYATHRDPLPTSSLLSHALDRKRGAVSKEDSVGPFRLGIPPSSQNAKDMKRWSELSAGGKVLRTTARTTNLLVILFGAGFSAMLVYALTSELFSKNSPTVLYGQACDLIKSSPKVAQYLPGSLVFHNNPPTSIRPRHRNDRVASQITRDSSGREHMLLNFFVQAKPGSYSADEDPSWYSSTVDWTKRAVSKLSEMSLDEVTDAAGQHASEVMDSCKRMFRFLTGDPLPSTQPVSSPVPEVTEEKKSSSWKSGAIGLFSVLRSSTKEPKESGNDVPDEHAYTDGEVHADLVMNDQGLYEFRYLRIDIPDSQTANPKRIFVVSSSGPGTRDSRWR